MDIIKYCCIWNGLQVNIAGKILLLKIIFVLWMVKHPFLAVSSLLSVSMNKLLVSYDKVIIWNKNYSYHFVHLVIHWWFTASKKMWDNPSVTLVSWDGKNMSSRSGNPRKPLFFKTCIFPFPVRTLLHWLWIQGQDLSVCGLSDKRM